MAISKRLIKQLNKLYPKTPEYIEGITEVFEESKIFNDKNIQAAWDILVVDYKIEYNNETQRFEKKSLTCFDNVKNAFNELYPDIDAYINEAFNELTKEALEADRNCRIDDEPKQQENIFEFDESEVLEEDYEEEVNPDVEA